MRKVKIIAEIANAHQGDITILNLLIAAAANSGANAVKFQLFKYSEIATEDYKFYEDYKTLFIQEENWKKAIDYAKSLNLEVWVDIIDHWGLSLAKKFKQQIDGVKLPSTILQSNSLLEGISVLNKQTIIGVGGWSNELLEEIIPVIQNKLLHSIILMDGVQNYPTKIENTNLAHLSYLKEKFNLCVGYADHTDASNEIAIDIPVYAYFLGAEVIEKHITLNRNQKGFDYYSSLEPYEFYTMVQKLRLAERIMGNGEISEIQQSYLKDSLRTVAATDIQANTLIGMQNIVFKKCPDEKALIPSEIEKILPAITTKKLRKNEPIQSQHIRKPIVTITVICRLKSTRLKEKALRPIYGIPAIERCLLNCLACKHVDHVILATSDLPQDDRLDQFTMNQRVRVFRGNPNNIAKRMVDAVKGTNTDIIIRVTGDNPAVSPEIIDYLIESHLNIGADFTTTLPNQCPLGTDANIINMDALIRLLNQPKPLTHTEYLNAYFENNPELFTVNLTKLPQQFHFPNWRLTLDEPQDLELFEKIYKSLNVGYEPLYFSKLSRFLSDNPEIRKINDTVSKKWIDNHELAQEIKNATRLI